MELSFQVTYLIETAHFELTIEQTLFLFYFTTLSFGKFVMQHPAFISGDFDTHFVKNYFTPAILNNANKEDEMMIASFVATQLFETKTSTTISNKIDEGTNWVRNRKNF